MKQGCLYQPPFRGEQTYMIGTAGSSFMNHKHMEIEVLYCLDGSARVILKDEPYRLNEGEMLLVLPMENHLIDSEDSNDLFFLELGEAFLGKEFSFFTENGVHKRKYTPDREMRELLVNISKKRCDRTEREIYDEWKTKALLYTFAAKLIPMLEGVEKMPKKTEEKTRTSIRLDGLFVFIHQNYMNDISLQTAEEIVGYEKKYICRIFKEATGLTFHKYINACRIDRACIMIDEGKSFSEVRNAVGLPDERTFIRVFTSCKEMTPTEYKNRRKVSVNNKKTIN